MKDEIKVRLGWFAGQFSDTTAQHQHDAQEILDFSAAHGLDLVGVSETGAGPGSTYREALAGLAPMFGYRFCWHHGQDTALMVARTFGTVLDREFVRCVEPNGDQDPGPNFTAKGLFTVAIEPHDTDLAPVVTVGLTHFLTERADPSQRVNRMIARQADATFTKACHGRKIGFAMGDLNLHDDKVDGFAPAQLRTCWDDLGRYPATHGPRRRGSTIDVIARYDPDQRVRLLGAREFYDDTLDLFIDHHSTVATYAVTPL